MCGDCRQYRCGEYNYRLREGEKCVGRKLCAFFFGTLRKLDTWDFTQVGCPHLHNRENKIIIDEVLRIDKETTR